MKKVQKFKGKETTQTKVVKNLLRYYSLASPEEIEAGKVWYKEANAFCQEVAQQYKLEVWKVAGIVAALSPQTTWVQNKIDARNFIAKRGRGFMGQRDRVIKAKRILNASNGEEVHSLLSTKPGKALKTKAFYRNICLPGFCDTTTIDRHSLAAALQRPDNTAALSDREGAITEKQYRFLSECYVKAARKVGLIPHEMQAVVWTRYRKQRGLEKPALVEGYTPMNIEDF